MIVLAVISNLEAKDSRTTRDLTSLKAVVASVKPYLLKYILTVNVSPHAYNDLLQNQAAFLNMILIAGG
jgi:hypothetical protein